MKSSQEVVEAIPSLPIIVFVENTKISDGPETPHCPVKDSFTESFFASFQEMEGSNIVMMLDFIW